MIVNKPDDIQRAFSRFLIAGVQVKTEESTSPEKIPVVAKLNYVEIGVCPYCQKPMTFTEACDQRVYLCEKDRFVSPLPNIELEEQK